jgi:hypothetical protein
LTNATEHKPKPVAAETAQVPTKSKGEKFFDRVVYGGIAGVGTFAATLYMANKFKNGEWAGQRYKRAVSGVTNLLKKVLPQKWAESIGTEAIQTTSLMMGGNVMLLPVWYAEKHKTKIVEGLNVAMGDPTPPEKIEQAPKQTTLSLIQGRALAWCTVFGALVAAQSAFPKTFRTYCKEVGEITHKAVQGMKRQAALTGKAMKETTSYRIGTIAALDIFATAAAVVLLYIGGHFFARKQEQKKEVRAARRHAAIGETRQAEATFATPAEVSLAKSEPASQIGGDRQHQGLMAAAPELQAGMNA